MDPALNTVLVSCPVCGGWGVSPPFSTKLCGQCDGAGMKLVKGNTELFLSFPSYTDFVLRAHINKKKIATVLLVIVIIQILIILVVLLIKNGFTR